MKIESIFKKDIKRSIEGVIKADNLSDEAVFNEVDEYVITKDLAKDLDMFFDIYSSSIGTNTQDIGVWISGYFGSGKSHLLKILSFILSNQSTHSDLIGEVFLQKVEDIELKNNIQKALKIPSQSILFNIDQKAETGMEESSNALVSVFMKVFNEMRGYYAKFGYIAKFENDLDKQNLLETFKQNYEKLSGDSWENGREVVFLENENVALALSKTRDMSVEKASDIIEKYEQNYSISIEEFADEVKEYISSKDKDFRLIFCIDEVGQYIGDDLKLMLNLQTIVETLATKCGGRAWVIVTSQNAVQELLESSKSTEFDFSKIMGRFKTKLNLTSANANEVIQKRLLQKNEDSHKLLTSTYEKVQNSLTSLLHFSDRGRQYKTYKNADDFSSAYPFVPYQMDLFQSCMLGLSKNNVFQGKHQSFGERSMLEVIQNVAKEISSDEVNILATYDRFYDGISGTIRGEIQTHVSQAITNLGKNSLEVKILKILFMVKYVQEFNANIDNLTTLLVNSLHVNISKLKSNISKALHVLVEQVYIQKVGENFEFLTDAEKDIENEIKSTEIEPKDLTIELSKWIYDDILRGNKIRFEQNKHDYTFARKMDGILVRGNEEELCLNIITPLESDNFSEDRLIHKTLADRDVILKFESNFEFVKDLEIYVKTNKFIPKKQSSNLSDVENSLLFNKANDNSKRRVKLQNDLKEFFKNAKIYFNGILLDINSNEPKTLIDKAFNEAIITIYPSIFMLKKIYTEAEIKEILFDALAQNDDTLNEAENDIYNYLKRQKNAHQNITLRKLLDIYTKKPYGWCQNAIICLVTSMYMKKRVNLKQNANILTKKDISEKITNNRNFDSIIISIMVKIDDEKIKKARIILTEFFPHVDFSSLAQRDIISQANEEYINLKTTLQNYTNFGYKFNNSFIESLEAIKIYEDLDDENFYEKIFEIEDELLDTKEELIDPLLEFMSGNKRKIYDDIKDFYIKNQDNLFYIENSQTLEEILKDKQPYLQGKIQKAKVSLEQIKQELEPIVTKTKQEADERIDEFIQKLQNDENFQKVPTQNDDRNKILKPFLSTKESIKTLKSIDTIKQRSSLDELDKMYETSYELMLELIPEDEAKTKKQNTKLKDIQPKTKHALENIEDVDEYLSKLKEKMYQEIQNGREIIL